MALSDHEKNEAIKTELGHVIHHLKEQGIKHNSKEGEIEGLGDKVEQTLTALGITEERYKEFFNLKECSCKERKKFLNNLLSWHKKA